MKKAEILDLIAQIKGGKISDEKVVEYFANYPFSDIGCAKVDMQRELRSGVGEVIYGEGKSAEAILAIARECVKNGNNVLITRTNSQVAEILQKDFPLAKFNEVGRTISIIINEPKLTESYIGIISAGTSDSYAVEEAYETAKFLGNDVRKITDVGVAGINRLFLKLDEIQKAKVLIVIAGMEGALPSVIAGLVKAPVIAVPTSVGYGASFGGVAALLGMLNSCANGISVVNIDNGYGAAYNASIINHL
ncbi:MULTISPECIES: nickel pincer cofactor biosynthesis protein LarB [unclassified Campylobacter]|uniref:nickel pincer cofactor biosynthesis protein LarB n=1 Tax=unclassified Campylobacter TaxID=2593542 RepID=UPI0022E9DD11|nr:MULTISPECIES: nickel pincer cofactor biosynthesis protein LarB [unclassified Campylobacter]MDA3050036.1 nickel pincer cofactor biosynthesis protein LarB [Campylobacter sp. JMF_15 NE4]MDA3050994.1 nickel pincer cofactor biosynthesis protein LarB [Campylobacter sp. JMF_02 ED1]MDA3054673.1 nickel pincer cofactor biosynthesis protein LarB [Campylobacter sp. VBCF_07 NA4]MDA3058190.1 nickel pincer cofactor biosynthesis protein LarB [Campylobacter sp. VBCF_04 NA7]MDA3059761.1 nickel pincer cofacto